MESSEAIDLEFCSATLRLSKYLGYSWAFVD